MRLLFVIGHLGDYHVPRYEALSRLALSRGDDLFLVEVFGHSGVYRFAQTRRDAFFAARPLQAVTLEPDLDDAGGRWFSVVRKLTGIVQKIEPDVVVTLGNHTPYSLWLCALKYIYADFKLIYMSDSKADDGKRYPLKESLKRIVVSRFDGAFVAGERHRAYANSLGIPLARSRVGFDVIDVEQFSAAAARARDEAAATRATYKLPERYVLCVSRFVERKNVDIVIAAYARAQLDRHAISLVLAGQGPCSDTLRAQVSDLGLNHAVQFLDPLPNEHMPALYALSEFVVLASRFDQWGLCINEAFAATRTVIATPTCGAVGDLLLDGVNGLTVAPGDTESLAQKMHLIATNTDLRETFARQARVTVESWSPDFFASGLFGLADSLVGANVPYVQHTHS